MSKRHNMVTRKETKTVYTMTILTADGKKSVKGTEYGNYTEQELKAKEAAKLEAGKALLLDLKIEEQEQHLYGLPRDEYFAKAIILE